VIEKSQVVDLAAGWTAEALRYPGWGLPGNAACFRDDGRGAADPVADAPRKPRSSPGSRGARQILQGRSRRARPRVASLRQPSIYERPQLLARRRAHVAPPHLCVAIGEPQSGIVCAFPKKRKTRIGVPEEDHVAGDAVNAPREIPDAARTGLGGFPIAFSQSSGVRPPS
jgi:hypothetical protein